MSVENYSLEIEELPLKLHRPFDSPSMIDAFVDLATVLKPHLQRYDTIIGDDVSGRLPTLVIAELIKRKRKQFNLQSPSIYYINAGSNVSKWGKSHETLPKISHLISKHKQVEQKILLVTEYVSTGDSISILATEFMNHGMRPDICILDSDKNPSSILSLSPFKVYCGAIRSGAGGTFYFNPSLSGVKSTDCNPISERSDCNRHGAILARQDMKLIVQTLWKIIE